MKTRTEAKIRITTQAVQWLHRLEAEPTPETADEFAKWLRESPLHLVSFLKQSRIEEAMSRAHALRVSQSAGDDRQCDVPPNECVSYPRAAVAKESSSRMVRGLSIAALFLLLVLWGFLTARPVPYGTGATPDVVPFSAGSYADAYPYTKLHERSVAVFSRITVERGGGEFHVRHRIWQRFSVRAGGALITATGTMFNVLLRADDGTQVYVSDGSVWVEGRSQRIRLQQGGSVHVSLDGVIGNIHGAAPPPAAAADAAAAQRKWSNRTLAAIAEEINRRGRVPQIEVKGAARERRFRGDVPLDDPQAWVRVLATYSGLEIEPQTAKVIIRPVG